LYSDATKSKRHVGLIIYVAYTTDNSRIKDDISVRIQLIKHTLKLTSYMYSV